MNKYLVNIYQDFGDGATETSKIMNAAEIFDMMDMSDCYPGIFCIDVWKINGYGCALEECQFQGKHLNRDPQMMRIVGYNSGVLDVGYGTDH